MASVLKKILENYFIIVVKTFFSSKNFFLNCKWLIVERRQTIEQNVGGCLNLKSNAQTKSVCSLELGCHCFIGFWGKYLRRSFSYSKEMKDWRVVQNEFFCKYTSGIL